MNKIPYKERFALARLVPGRTAMIQGELIGCVRGKNGNCWCCPFDEESGLCQSANCMTLNYFIKKG